MSSFSPPVGGGSGPLAGIGHPLAFHHLDRDGRLSSNLVGRPAPVEVALGRAAAAVMGLSAALKQFANKSGFGGQIDLASKRLTSAGANDVERALLQYPDIRAYLLARAVVDKKASTTDVSSLAAAAYGLLGSGEAPKLKDLVKKAPSDPWETFFENLVAEVVRTRRLNVLSPSGTDLTADIISDLKKAPPGLSGSTVYERVERVIALASSDAKTFLDDWVSRGEIREELVTPRVADAMLRYVEQIGVDFQGPASQNYDEYFALAYQHALRRLATADDPIQAKFSGSLTESDFFVDPLLGIEQQQVIAKNIRAAGALDYIFQLGERLGVFALADVLVLRWAHGVLDIPDGSAADRLYRYWKLRDERSSAEERGLLYRRILAKGPSQVLRGMVVNDDFPPLWGNLMEHVVDFIDKFETTRADDRGPSKVRIARATKQLQYNLTEHMTGMAQVQTLEIYAQLRDALEILADPQVVSILAGGRRQTLWTVIERLTREEFGTSVNVEALRSVAVDGNRVFGWVAEYAPGSEDTAAFLEFLDAAETYIVAEASVQGDRTGWSDRPGAEDDDFDDSFDDFDGFDNFADDDL
jgi:hypothetical protein